MKIYLASDHRGFDYKNKIKTFLQRELKTDTEDVGAFTYNPDDDYPVFASRALEKIKSDPSSRGIFICGSGVGFCIAANRAKGVRCALGFSREQIIHARTHDDVNVLSIPAQYISIDEAFCIIRAFLETEFKNIPAYSRRIRQLDEIKTD